MQYKLRPVNLMSVSDDSANALVVLKPSPESRKAKRARIRARYESTDLSLRELARLEGESESTVLKWSMRYHWQQRAKLVRKVARGMESDVNEKIVARVMEELQPYIEDHKIKITKQGVQMGKRGLARLNTLWKNGKPSSSKAEAEGAKTLETLVRVVRTSLGMNDGQAIATPLSGAILISHSAVKIES